MSIEHLSDEVLKEKGSQLFRLERRIDSSLEQLRDESYEGSLRHALDVVDGMRLAQTGLYIELYDDGHSNEANTLIRRARES